MPFKTSIPITAGRRRKLLHASDFCRQTTSTDVEGVRVQFRILWEEPHAEDSTSAVVYVASTSLLCAAGLVVGRLALVQHQSETVVAHVKRLAGRQEHADNDDNVVYLPPLVAINLGCLSSRQYLDQSLLRVGRDLQDSKPVSLPFGSLQPYYPFRPPGRAEPPVAQRVTLKSWGQPLDSTNNMHLRRSGSSSTENPPRRSGSFQPQTSDSASAWAGPFPKAECWLQPGKLIRVMRKDGIPYYYQVLEVLTTGLDDEANEKGSPKVEQQQVAYETTSTTRYRFELGIPGLACPLLPPRRLPADRALHPAVPEMVSALCDASNLKDVEDDTVTNRSDSSVVAERMLHIVGTDQDHDVLEAVETTAALLGRTLVTVQGMACFAHLQAVARGSSAASITGSWSDKLAGLEAALQLARQQAPSVLYIERLDDELASSQQDEPLAEDHQERLWAVLTEQLLPEGSSSSLRRSFAIPRSVQQTPSVLVIVSTAQPISKNGPSLFRHHFWGGRSLTLPPPTASRAYVARSLWPRSTGNHDDTEEDETLLEYIWDHLCSEDRTAREIRQLQNAFLEARLVDDGKDPKALFDDLCEQHDTERRRESGQQAHIVPVHWEDVGGLAQVRSEILEAIELPLKYPDLFASGSSSGRSGILLYGPPGTGKTLVAKAVATECGLPFVSIKGPELLGSYVGESEARVRTIFEQARQLAVRNRPAACILFFDELDSLAPRRGDQASGGGNVMDRVVATLFAELDRHSEDCQVFVMGATNRPDLLDPSLLRPGRLDRLVYLGICPDDCFKILSSQIRKLRLDGTPDELAAAVVEKLPTNLTGADLSVIASGALLRATERLCQQADKEVEELRRQGNDRVTLDEVLATWDDDRLEPVVCLEDLLDAAAEVVPSVSAASLKLYESLREQFQK